MIGEINNIQRLVSFDFDDTLCHTPLPEDGKEIWFEKTGTEWPYRGWWSKPESLDLDVFEIPVNRWVYDKYLEEVARDSTYLILATGRLEPLRREVQLILNHHNLSFDEIYLNFGTDTFLFKTKLFENLIDRMNPEIFVMYDDRSEHLPRFEEWAISQPCRVSIVDVVNKNTKTFNS